MFCIAKDAKFLLADNKDSDQTARLHRLMRVFIGVFFRLAAHICGFKLTRANERTISVWAFEVPLYTEYDELMLKAILPA